LFFSLLSYLSRLESTLFPYTTLFRSSPDASDSGKVSKRSARPTVTSCSACVPTTTARAPEPARAVKSRMRGGCRPRSVAACVTRSEEHTSELQSRESLVCRLLLEKKK